MVSLVLPGAVPVARADASVTEFSFVSAPGDFIGQGGSGSYSPANWIFTITGYAGFVRFQLRAKDSFDDWEVDLAAPIGGQLHPGVYSDAQRATFRTGEHPGLDVSGPGRGCDQVFGSFVIRAISATSDGAIDALDATFSQNCESATAPPLQGVVKYRAPADGPIKLTSSNPVTVAGEPVTLTAEVAAGRIGVVHFRDRKRPLGNVAVDGNGLANLTTTRLGIGTHLIRATFNATASPTVVQNVRSNALSYWFISGATNGPLNGATASYARPADNVGVYAEPSRLTVQGFDLDNLFRFDFYPPSGEQLHEGTYSDLPGSNGYLSVGGGGACDVYRGNVTVNDIEIDTAGNVALLDVSFDAQCNYTGATITGRVHYQPGA